MALGERTTTSLFEKVKEILTSVKTMVVLQKGGTFITIHHINREVGRRFDHTRGGWIGEASLLHQQDN